MERFLPHYVNEDWELPTEYDYRFVVFFGLLEWKFLWEDIKYSKVDLDIVDTDIEIVDQGENGHAIQVQFPAIKHWEISAEQHVNTWILPADSHVQLTFKDFTFDFNSGLKLDYNGYLDPVVYSCSVHFGNSYFYHDDKLLALLMHQVIYFGIIILENSVSMAGRYVFTEMLGPVMDEYLNHYRYEFKLDSLIRG